MFLRHIFSNKNTTELFKKNILMSVNNDLLNISNHPSYRITREASTPTVLRFGI
jgi:hypothetical protein